MSALAEVMAEMQSRGKETTRLTYARHGMAPERTFGVLVAELKVIARRIKGQQALAMELYDTGMMEAMYLAGMVADGGRLSKKELEGWAEKAAGLQMIAETTVPWVTLESGFARELAMEWIWSKREHVGTAGWCSYSGLVATKPDEELDLAEIKGLLERIVEEIDGAANRVRYTMNGFVIAVGGYVAPLLKEALAAAALIGNLEVDVGDTSCKVPDAAAYIEKVLARGGKKRKTIRC